MGEHHTSFLYGGGVASNTPSSCARNCKAMYAVVPNNVVAPCGWYNDAIAVGHGTLLNKHRHQPSKQDVHGDVVNLPLSLGVEAIRFCLFGAGPSACSSRHKSTTPLQSTLNVFA